MHYKNANGQKRFLDLNKCKIRTTNIVYRLAWSLYSDGEEITSKMLKGLHGHRNLSWDVVWEVKLRLKRLPFNIVSTFLIIAYLSEEHVEAALSLHQRMAGNFVDELLHKEGEINFCGGLRSTLVPSICMIWGQLNICWFTPLGQRFKINNDTFFS